MIRVLLTLALLLLCWLPIEASAQCNGLFPNNTACANNSGAPAPPGPTTLAATSFTCSGVVGDGVTNNSAAIAACITAANAIGNITITLPTGIILAPTLAATITGANIWLVCGGGPGDCILKGSSSSMLTWNNGTGGGGLFNMGIDNAGATTNTSIVLATASAYPVQFLNIVLYSGVGTIIFSNGASIHVQNMTGQVAAVASTPLFAAVGGSIFISNSNIYTTGVYPPPAGRNVINAIGSYDSIQLTNNFFQIFDIGLLSSTDVASIASNVWLLGNVWDSILTSVASFAITGTLSRVHLNDRWMSSGSGPAIAFTGAGTVNNVEISTSIPKAGSSGIIFSVAAVNDLKIFGTIAVNLNNAAVAGTADGINILGGANYKNISVVNNSIGSAAEAGLTQPKNGCVFGAAIDHLTFIGNDCQGATANYNGMFAGTATTFTHTNFKQMSNVGLPDIANASTSSALLVSGADGTSNRLAFPGNNTCPGTMPCIRSDGNQLVLNPNVGGVIFLNLDSGIAVHMKGTLIMDGSSSGAVTIQTQAAAGTYNFNLPISAGTLGQPLLSGGGGATAQTYGTLGVGGGGTGATTLTLNGVLYGNGTSAIQATAQGGANTVLIANAGAPSFSASPFINTSVTSPVMNAGPNVSPNAGVAFTANNNTVAPASTSTSGNVVGQFSGADSTQSSILLDGFAGGIGRASVIAIRNARGTAASYTASQSGDFIGFFGFVGATGANTFASSLAAAGGVFFGAVATENWSATNQGIKMNIYTTPTGTANIALAMSVQASGGVSVGTATDPGTGALLTNTFVQATSYLQAGTKLRAIGAAPALTSCGTSPAIDGSDLSGTVTMGTGSPTGCVITFNAAYSNAPRCSVTWRTNIASMQYTVSTTAITLTQTATSSNLIDYICSVRTGGWLLKRDLDPVANDNTPAFMDQAA